MHALKIDGLSKSFGGVEAVKNVSFELKSGEHRGIIGPNGAGKTTFFNLITGQLRPDAGRIFLFDRDATKMPVCQRSRIGLSRTFQVMNLLSNLSVIDNVVLAVQALRSSAYGMFRPLTGYRGLYDEARKLMEPWGLSGESDTPVRELSYGQQRCLELVLSLASKPKLLLLDEPTCGMTPAEVTAITGMIRTLGKNMSIILIAHDMDLIFGLDLDVVTVFQHGQIVAEGSQEAIRRDPKVKEIYLGAEEERTC